MAAPEPTATVFTMYPVFSWKSGISTSSRPESWVLVVVARIIFGLAGAATVGEGEAVAVGDASVVVGGAVVAGAVVVGGWVVEGGAVVAGAVGVEGPHPANSVKTRIRVRRDIPMREKLRVVLPDVCRENAILPP